MEHPLLLDASITFPHTSFKVAPRAFIFLQLFFARDCFTFVLVCLVINKTLDMLFFLMFSYSLTKIPTITNINFIIGQFYKINIVHHIKSAQKEGVKFDSSRFFAYGLKWEVNSLISFVANPALPIHASRRIETQLFLCLSRTTFHKRTRLPL